MTWIDALRERTERHAERSAFTFLADGERELERWTYAELDRRARAVAAELQGAGLAGERVLLLYPPGLDFIAGFLGCLYAGALAVPAYPPRSPRTLPRLLAIARDARPRAALTVASLRPQIARFARATELAALPLLASDEAPGARAGEWRRPELSPESLAFLQYTSGSTADPKGVMVSHGNLLANEEAIRRAFGQSEESVVVGWLPLYHDMGLIGNVLQPLFCGGRAVLMSPVAFLQKPLRWLAAIDRHRATTSGGPNFAYELCLAKISAEERRGLDLASWELAFNGAEPIRAETLARFADAFAPSGFRRAAFFPCYGLAEATLFVAGARRGAGARVGRFDAQALERGRAAAGEEEDGRALVSCGGAGEGHEVAVVDPETARPCAAGEVGEIWVRGASVAQGYWGKPQETARDFAARLASGDGPYLRTGDLGFVAGGELYVTGRIKDLVILRGRNLYPQDLERTAERSHPGLRAGCGAAFSVTGASGEDGERLVVVQEVERHARDMAGMAAAIRAAVAEEHEAQVHDVVLVREGTVPKTSSGKVRRAACRERYLAGALDPLAASPLAAGESAAGALDREALAGLGRDERRAAVAAYLAAQAARAARVPPSRIDPARPLSALGLDSLGAIELASSVAGDLGVELSMAALLAGPTLAEVTDEVVARLAAPAAEAADVDPIVEAQKDSASRPVSHGERALWLLDRLAPEDAAYVIAGAARVRGALDVPALRRALAALVARHDALRTSFRDVGGEPAARVLPAAEPGFAVEDAAEWTASELAAAIDAAAHRPFDLAAGSHLRAAVFRRGGDEHLVVLAVHHVAADFWSMGVLLGELGALYAGAAPESLPPPGGSWAAAVSRENRRLAGPEGERLVEHWRAVLAGKPQALDLPADRPRPRAQTFRGDARFGRLPAALAERLAGLCRGAGATLFMGAMAAFQALLGRLSGQEELLVGTPMAGPRGAALAGRVGYLVNPVAVAADLRGEPGFAALLARVRAAALAAFAHQELPFPLLAERLAERDPSRSPIFQAMLVLHGERRPSEAGLAGFALGDSGATLSLGGLELESVRLAPRGAQLDLTLALAPMSGRLDGALGAALRFNRDLFDGTTAERLLGYLATLLAAAVEEPSRSVWELLILTDAERRQMLVEWNGGAGEPAAASSDLLHEPFFRRAAAAPERTALVLAAGEVTYGELALRARRMAAGLKRRGVGPEVPVAVCLPRGADLVAAIYAVLAAGGAYVPLDPAYPPARLALMAADSGARAVVAAPELAARLAGAGVAIVAPEDLAQEEPDEPDEEPGDARIAASPQSLAYVIYTSGSTGRPKGVAVPHAAAAAFVRWGLAELSAAELAGAVFSTSVCFDVSVLELFVPLAAGGALVVAEDALALADHPAAGRATLLSAVPSAVAELARGGWLPPSLQTVALGGEPVPRGLADELYERTGVARVLDVYGPTECTVYSTWAELRRGERRAPPIGRPVAGAAAYVVDRRLSPQPAGVPGELLVGGAGVARGYLGRPELTAERFLPDPFSGRPGARLYRTGDLVAWDEAGELAYLGRLDDQVKVKGYRVELGEVEAALRAHPAVAETAVAVRAGAAGDPRLVAYAVPAAGRDGDAERAALAESLRAELARALPAHMVPAAFVVLAALPRTPSGKLDRKALPEPLWAAAAGGEAPPRTPLEEIVAGLWSDVLGLPQVGAEDDFFRLGGHSLLASQVVSRLRAALGVELPLRALFEAPTVAGLAARIERARGGRGVDQAPPIARSADAAPVLSFAQERLWVLDQLAPGGALYNMPAVVRLAGALDRPALAAALAEVARRHEVLRTAFPRGAEGPLAAVAPAVPSLAIPAVDLGALPETAREGALAGLAADEARRPFDLAKGPLLRATLVRSGAMDHALLVTLHHIVADGWSIGVLAREVSALYPAAAAGRPSPLPEPRLQYADFARWQRSSLAGEALESRLARARARLAGAPIVLDLPADRPRPPVSGAASSSRGGELRRTLPGDLAAGLAELGRASGATLFMTLLAGWTALLGRYAGMDDLLVGSPAANRDRLETEGLIGLFVNTVALRARPAGETAASAHLARLRDEALDAYADQDLPFEKLVEALAPERDLARTPLVQVLFALQNVPAWSLALPGLDLDLAELPTGEAKLDLEVEVAGHAGEGGGLPVRLGFRRDLFDAATVERMAGHWQSLLAGMAARPAAPLADLPLLSAAEEAELRAWERGAERPAAEETGVLARFAAQVRQRPAAPAVRWAEGELGYRELTFRELAARASAVAARLRELGVGRESIVGLSTGRNGWLAAGVLGIWKAGAAFLPLDPTYPRERLLWMLTDSGAAAVAGEPAALAALAPPADLPAVALDDLAPKPGLRSRRPRPADLAYVIYTSGSTGRPKGVAVEHGSLSSLLAASLGELGWSAGDVSPALAPYSFDIFLFELLSPLSAGGCCELVELQPALDVPALVARLPRFTRLHAVPALMRQVVEGAARLPEPPPIEALFTGGDSVPRELLLTMRSAFPGAELRVLYGPTEGTVVCTSLALAPGEAPPEAASIGRPLAGMEVSVRDAAGRRLPVGVPGEIWIGGPGIARGYLGRSELTQERFVTLAAEGGRRWYRTGDLARRLPSGELAFLGRADGQVKLRGFRVELGEIEGVLAEHPEVAAAVAAVSTGPSGDRRLVAYAVPRGGLDAADGARWRALEPELRALLAARLPDYMVPAALVPLAGLPLLPTGKVDRRALPEPPWAAPAASDAPRTPTEEIVAAIWAELLGLPRLGRHDGFFALGGHSLLATQAASRLSRALGIELPLRALFEAPTVAGLAAWLDRRLAGETAAERPPLLPRASAPGFDAAAPLPLSFAQERLWFLHRLEPESPLYNIPVGVRLQGPLVPDDLAAALSAIARRHEALRTLVREAAGEPVQSIAAPAPVPLPEFDLRRSPEAVRRSRAEALARAEAERPFDLASEPPLRALLLRLADEERWLVLSVHHIAADGWSMGVLVRELSEIYRARRAGEAPALPELPVQYADFALWQRAWLAGGALERQLAWWRERLAGATAALDLPADRPRPALRTRPAGLVTTALPPAEAGALQQAALAAGATPFMVLLAAWQAQLARLCGQDELSIGTPIANRTLVETEGLIGLFVNTLVLRGEVAAGGSFGELVARAREAALGAYAHQDLPFEKLVEALAPERDLGQTPLFQVMLAVQNAPLPALDLGGLSWTPLPVHSGRAKFDLTLSVTAEGDGLAAVLEHDAELFDATTAERLLAQWRTALAAGVADPGLAVSDLPLLAAAERQQLLCDWGDGGAPAAAEGLLHELLIHELFWAAARRTPGAAAVLCDGRAVTYAELAERAAALARRLRARGVGPEVRVGVCLPRTPDLVAALLAVLAAGGAYVPMDPAYPAERLLFMAADAGVAAVLTSAAAEDRLAGVAAPLLRLEDLAPEPEPPESAAPALEVQNLAYVIYTSGSTGVPKGVAIAHRSAAALVAWARGVVSDVELSGVLASTSVCFDLSVFELFVPLAFGGRVILAPDALHLPRLAEAGEVRLVNTVPSAIAELARAGGLPPAVRTVCLAGEPLVRPLADELYGLGVERVLDLYGPTEDTTYSTWAPVERRGERAPAIGRPLPGTRARVLDPALGLVPAGVAGELFLGGLGLARGYLGRPALTAERFVPDPFAAGERMYRTGDRARWRKDGELEYLGRLDHQVKVRGYRIELGEVEAALKACPGVREAAVLARADGPGGDRRLVAYVAGAGGEEDGAPASALRAALRQRLPEPMVPSAFVLLPALPLQPNGKVDRKALSRIAPALPAGAGAGAAPRTPWEELVAGIWSEVLSVERVGVDSSFFDLGGHSLLATRVVSRLRRACGVELPLRALFETPTVAGLARRLAAEAGGAVSAPPPIRRLPAGTAAPLSFAQERMWFLHRLDPEDASYHMPLGARLAGRLDLPVLAAAMAEIARRHEVLRTAFASEGGRPAPRVLPARPQALPILDLSALPAPERERLAAELATAEARRPFDLAAMSPAPSTSPTPPMRTTLLRLGATEHRILFILHHIVADGWSVGLYLRELAALYRAFAAGRPSPLPELALQYADFAAWQRERLAGEVFAAQLAFWRGELAGAPLVLELPADRPRPAVRGLAGGRSPLPLPAELAERLARFGRREGVTLFMTLLAAFQALLGRLTGQETVLVGSPIAGRSRADVEGLIGFFANTLVLRGDLAGEPGLSALAARAREHTLEAHLHQDLPFEKLVEAMEPQRNLAVTPLFQAMLALQNASLGASELPGLRLTPFEIDSGTAKFDLTVAFSEEGGAVDGWLEHGRDLFDPTTGRRIASQYLALLAAAVERPEEPLARLPLLAAGERHQLVVEWNDTAAPAPEGTLHGLFEAQAAARPGATAVVCRGERWTYAEVNARANRIARLLERCGVRAGDNVGIWMRRGPDAVAALLGVLKAGAAYVPVDPDWPSARRLVVLRQLAVPVVLAESSRLRSIEEIEWRLPALGHVVCLDVETPRVPPEPLDAAAVAGMWDHVAARAGDRVGAAGFVSSYTGRPFSEAEVDEYLARVVGLARPYLGPDKRVLEVGCGSGLVLFALAPQVGRYVGLDPSPATQERNRRAVLERGLAHVELATGFAHEVDRLPAAEYDLVILASVAQFFPGRVYLERVIESLLARLAPGGAILLADLLDDREKDGFRRSLEEFHDLHRGDPAIRTKAQTDSELYLDEDLFADLAAEHPAIGGVHILHRTAGFDNELKRRFDVVLEKAGAERTAPAPARRKSLWTAWHLAGLPADDHPTAAGDALAYTIFTSGSTGVPKGVAMRHRPAVNLVRWANETYGVGPADRVLFVASLCFDLSVYDVFGLLAAGGSVHVATEDELRDPQALVRLLVEEPITFWDSAPAGLQHLVPFFPLSNPIDRAAEARLRLVFLSGDWIPVTLPDRVRASFPRARVIALGGATEAAIWSNHYPVGEVGEGWRSIPYGRPLASCRYHVLDPEQSPCPTGVPGDLAIGGICLAIGYYGDAVQTAERFVPDPAGLPGIGEAGARVYRTGDRARYLADGNLEFLGRRDHQVKIRGFRIEQGEIESALAAHPGVRANAVVVREDVPGDRRLVAYLVPRGAPGANAPDDAELRSFLRGKLPEYMVPAAFVPLAALPLTANGKLDRQALPAPVAGAAGGAGAIAPPANALERRIAAIWQEALGRAAVGRDDNFFEIGGHSLLMAELHGRLQALAAAPLTMVDLFRYPTVRSLAAHLAAAAGETAEGAGAEGAAAGSRRAAARAGLADGSRRVAIVGMAGRFPGAGDVEALWANLLGGVESISRFTAAELVAAGADPALVASPDYVPARGTVDGADLFDAAFFGFTPREAEIMDPQQRLFLECAWEALEDAGYAPGSGPAGAGSGAVGLFAGASLSGYLGNLYSRPDVMASAGDYPVVLANDKDFLATRVSYKLDLKGPSVAVQTACSTSLVAVHLACRSLLDGECDLALAGGVSIKVPLTSGDLYREGGILSPDGHCRPFDAAARGTVNGSGVGLVVLKRLDDAVASGDRIVAVIRGSAVNNDGSAKVGYTAPSVDGQAAVIAEALAAAGVEPAAIGYVEAHGTGTRLGDPIEAAALAQALGARAEPCVIGSIKSNLGHLDAAAGVAGLIKAALAVGTGVIPPSLHFERPNPEIDFAASGLAVAARRLDWDGGGAPRRAGVSSFGIGGTNAHVVLEEAPAVAAEPDPRPRQLVVLSARSEQALDRAAERLADRLDRHPELDWADVAFTLQVGRRAFPCRRALVAADAADARRALAERDPARLLTHTLDPSAPEPAVAFLFPGQGAQHAGMVADLCDAEPAFRAHLARAAELARPHLGVDLLALLHPAEGEREAAASALARPEVAPVALFAVETALARLWMDWGVKPRAMIGHSLGEYAAACIAGVFTLPEGIALVADRAALMASLPAGAMLAVPLPEAEVAAALSPFAGLALAAVNAPGLAVVSGPPEPVAAFAAELAGRGISARPLPVALAFHSSMMEPILDRFAERVARLALRPPQIPYVSNLTGRWIEAAEATDPRYWARQLRATVRFGDGLATLAGEGEGTSILLEVGPGKSLASFAKQGAGRGASAVLSSLGHRDDAHPAGEALLAALGRLWLAGVAVDWRGVHAGYGRRRVALPTYPFERRRFWIERARGGAAAAVGAADGPRAYVPVWRRAPLAAAPAPLAAPARWLLFADGAGLGAALTERLRRGGAAVATVVRGTGFAHTGERAFAVGPDASSYAALAGELARVGESWSIVHLWGLDAAPREEPRAVVERGFASLLLLGEALREAGLAGPFDLAAVAHGLFEVTGRDRPRPAAATLLGALRALACELPGCIAARAIDVSPDDDRSELAERLAAELAAPADPALPHVAYRAGRRWIEVYDELPAPARDPGEPRSGGEPRDLVVGAGKPAMPLAEALAAAGPRDRLIYEIASGGPATAEPLAAVGAATALLAALEAGEALVASARAAGAGALVFLSSLQPLVGGRGLAVPCAVAAYADALAESARRERGTAVLALHRQTGDGAAERERAAIGAALEAGEPRAALALRDPRTFLPGELEAETAACRAVAPPRRGAGESGARPVLGTPYQAPRDALEGQIAGLWQELLGIAPIGVHDNFYELGGHSLLATQLVSRLRELAGVRVALEDFFGHPTVAGLAAWVAGRQAERLGDEELAQILAEVQEMGAEEVEAWAAMETGMEPHE